MEFSVVLQPTQLNPDIGDLALSDAGSEVLTTLLSEEVAQRLTVKLNFFKGEWFVNLFAGTPYFQQILGKAADSTIRSVMSSIISETEGVASLSSLEVTRDRAARTVAIKFVAVLEDGTTFVSSEYAPFVVSA